MQIAKQTHPFGRNTLRPYNTDCVSLEVFDEERADNAAAANGLPERIVFHLANDVQLKLICDDLEYCYIIIEKVNPLNQKYPPLP